MQMVDEALTTAYVVALLATGVIALGVGLWAYVTSESADRRLFLGVMGIDCLWAIVAAIELIVGSPGLTMLFGYLRQVVTLVALIVWYVFATVYAGRTIRRWRHVALLAPLLVLGLFGAASPLPILSDATVTLRTEPLSFVQVSLGTLGILTTVWVFVVFGLGLYYLGELFVKSRHRASESVMVLILGTVVSFVPFVASSLEVGPVPGYDHTVFGVTTMAIASGYAVFALGIFDIRPIARDNLIDTVDDALLVLDDSGQLVDYNTASERLAEGLRDGDPIGESLRDLCPAIAAEIDLPETDESRSTDVITVQQRGRRTHYRGNVTPVFEKDAVVGYSVILRDVTPQIEYQRELEQRNEQLDQFASAVAHDLRNPLQVAMGRLPVIESELADRDDEEVQTSVTAVESSLDRMDVIISDLRTLAENGKSVDDVTVVDFGEEVRAAWAFVETAAGSVEIVADGTIEAAPGHLSSIFENLFRNAVEHGVSDEPSVAEAPEDAVEHGSTSPDAHGSAPSIRAGLTEEGFFVADDGPGISPADRAAVFEYGHTESEDGTGLGLSIVQTMANAHGWEVSVTESEDGGARFEVTGAVTTVETGEADEAAFSRE